MDINSKQITDQLVWIKKYWKKLDTEMPYKCTTGHGVAKRFMIEEQALEFFRKHDGRCLLSYYPPFGGVKFLRYKWYQFDKI